MYSISLLDILTLPILCFVWYIDCCVAIYTNLSCQFDNIACENVHFYCENSFTYKKQQVLPHHSQEMLQFQQRTQMLWKFLWNAPVVVAGKQDELQQQQFDKTFSWFHNKNQQKKYLHFFSNPIYKKTFEFDKKFQLFRPPHKNINKKFLVKMPFSLDFDNKRGHSYSNSFQRILCHTI